jgi:excisionase family DNA binding protein
VDEVCTRLAVRRPSIYALIHRGELKAVRVGRLWRIPADAVARFVAGGGAWRDESGGGGGGWRAAGIGTEQSEPSFSGPGSARSIGAALCSRSASPGRLPTAMRSWEPDS